MKRGNGFGTIEKTRDGKYRARRAGGKRETIAIYDTRDEAERILAGWNAAIQSGDILADGGITLATFAAEWFTRRRLHGNQRAQKVRDVENEWSVWTNHVLPSDLASNPLDMIRRVEVQDWLQWMAKRPAMRSAHVDGVRKTVATGRALSVQTMKHALRLVRQVFDDAVAREFITSNPAKAVVAPQSTAVDAWTFLSSEEIGKVAALPPQKARPLLFAIYTGVRQAELWRMRWRDVDMDRKRFTVSGQTKNGKERTAPLLPAAIEVLKAQRGTRTPDPMTYLFARPDKKPFASSYDGGWDDRRARVMVDGKATLVVTPGLRTEAGILRHVRFHDLRHTCASHLITGTWGRGWRLEEVCSFLGHSSISVTQRYAHLVDGHLDTLAASTIDPGCPPLPTGPLPTSDSKSAKLFAVRPAGLEPATFGLEGQGSIDLAATKLHPVGNPWATGELAAKILRAVANGGAELADVEALAMTVMDRDDVRLAMEILADLSGPHALRRAVELAALVLGASHRASSEAVEK